MKRKRKADSPKLEGNLKVMFLKEGDTFIVHCPALDLSSCGETLDQAQENFKECAGLFVAERRQRGALEKVLTSCGWTVQAR